MGQLPLLPSVLSPGTNYAKIFLFLELTLQSLAKSLAVLFHVTPSNLLLLSYRPPLR